MNTHIVPDIIIITIIICTCATIIGLSLISYIYDSKKPENNCLHEMETKEYVNEHFVYHFSSCKKCGKQKQTWFRNEL